MAPDILTLTDTHAHLADPAFDADRTRVLQRARDAGVGAVVTVGETLEEARRILDLAHSHPEIIPAAGLHPVCLDLDQAEETAAFIDRHADRFAAVGEVGLDYWKVQDEEGRAVQRTIFEMFIQLSRRLDLPLNVHSRSASRRVVEILLASGAGRVQLHAFDGRASSALPALEAGYLFSIPPSIVRSRQKQKLVRALPLGALLLESDSPALGPDPERRNEPANILVALKAVAEIKGVSEDAVREAVIENTAKLYGIGARTS